MTTQVGANLARAIGANVLELADQRGWTVKELSERAEVRFTQLQRQLNGDDAMNTNHMVKLARALDVPTSALLASVVGDPVEFLGDVDFEEVVHEAHREGWAMARG